MEAFRRRILDLYGAAGDAWLATLPAQIAACEERWSLRVLPPFPLSYNYVAPALTAAGEEVVLKFGAPSDLIRRETAALRHYAGHGAVYLLDADDTHGILLLERLHPGVTLATLPDDDAATAIAARVMRELWRPLTPPHPFPTVTDWAQGLVRLREHFHGGVGPLPRRLVEMAEALFADLLMSQGEAVLLHGDLHHFNILAAQRAPWLALDPQGVVGEREYEVGALLRNPFTRLPPLAELRHIEARRIAILAEQLGFDRRRLAGWGMAQAVLSAWWDIEDQGAGWESAVAYAEALAGLVG